jgi:ribosome-binding factor A
VVRQVVAEALERLADTDDRLALVTVTAVEVDPDLRHARVLFDSIPEPAADALREARVRLQGVIASEVRLKRTPQLSFAADPAVSTGRRVEDILRQLRTADESSEPGGHPAGPGEAGG